MKKFKANLILNYNIFPHGFNAYLASKLTGVPAIFSEINEDTKVYYKNFIPRLLISAILKNAEYICVPGQQTASYWETRGYGKTYSLHSTIDTGRFKPDPKIKKEFDFIYVGVFDRNKRPELIVEAFAEVLKTIPAAKLCMIGFGGSEGEVRERIRKLNLEDNVVMVKTQNVLEYFHRSDIFIMASLSEGLPCAMMEAMASGLVVIVPGVGDIPDVIQHGINGFLHDNSRDSIVSYMQEAINNHTSMDHISAKARDTIIAGHSYEVATRRWNDLLKRIEEPGSN